MLVGAHVSPAGGLARAVQRGTARGAQAIQFFNQSPRAWRTREYAQADVRDFRAALADSKVQAVLIHAVYLLNCASEDPEIRAKTLAALISALRAGSAIGGRAVILHPGSAKTGDVPLAIGRVGEVVAEALAESERCPVHLENTAGAGGTLGRSFEELARLLEACGGGERLGVCLDSCHLLASGYDVRGAHGLATVIDAFDQVVGLGRLGSLHLNDSQGALGSNRDRHANLGEGELGRAGCAAFLSEPRFEGLPCVLETPGDAEGTTAEEVALAFALREQGLAARRSRRSTRPRATR